FRPVDRPEGSRSATGRVRVLPDRGYVRGDHLRRPLIVEEPSRRTRPAEVLAAVLRQVVPVVRGLLVRPDDADVQPLRGGIPLDPIRVTQAVGVDLPAHPRLAVKRIVPWDRAVLVDAQHLTTQVLQVLRGPLRVGQPRPVIFGQAAALHEALDRFGGDLLRWAGATLSRVPGGDEERTIRAPREI